MSVPFSEIRAPYIIDQYSTDTKEGNILSLCCLDEYGYFEAEVENRKLVFFVERGTHVPELRGMVRKRWALQISPEENWTASISIPLRLSTREGRDFGTGESGCLNPMYVLTSVFSWSILFFAVSISGGSGMITGVRTAVFPLCRAVSVKSADVEKPGFRIMSLDIETGQDGSLYCCGFHVSGRGGEQKTVFMLDPSAGTGEKDYKYIPVYQEKELVRKSLEYIKESDPDIIIGWNVIGFDFSFIERKCSQFGIPFNLGRRGQRGKIIRKRSGLYSIEAYGRIVIDGPVTLRGGFHTFGDYRLETVARELLGEGKDISGHADSGEKIAEIEDRFANDKEALAYYNIQDCVLVTKIFQKTGLIDQLVTRSILTGLRMDKVNQSVEAFDFFMLPRIHRAGYAAPDTADIRPGGHAAGGLVFTSDAGLYKNIMVMDFLSLYPSIIRTFNIDPLSRLTAAAYPDVPACDTPPGIRFSRDSHILPERIRELMESRAKAKKDGDGPLSQAVKILMNSFYGVMGTTGCRFYHQDLPTAITGTGQWILRNTADYLRNKGFRVIYGDTDSVFVEILGSEETDYPAVESDLLFKRGEDLTSEINLWFEKKLAEDFGVESKLVLEVEKLYSRFFLPPMRGSAEGSRKRYAGLIADSDEIELKGLEYVRSDWTALAKEFQMELFRRFFAEEEIPEWIRERVKAVQSGGEDEKLVYRKRLTKPASEYVKNVPPHVKAAKLLEPSGRKKVRRVEYLMTVRGPVPVQFGPEDIDYNHYIEKQIIPLADAVLPFLGTSFSEIVDGRQGELF